MRTDDAIEELGGLVSQNGGEGDEALDAIKDALTGTIPKADIIGPGEIRALAGGITRQTFKQWRDGANLRGAGAFPQPIKSVSGVELYDRRAVLAWLEEHR